MSKKIVLDYNYEDLSQDYSPTYYIISGKVICYKQIQNWKITDKIKNFIEEKYFVFSKNKVECEILNEPMKKNFELLELIIYKDNEENLHILENILKEKEMPLFLKKKFLRNYYYDRANQ